MNTGDEERVREIRKAPRRVKRRGRAEAPALHFAGQFSVFSFQLSVFSFGENASRLFFNKGTGDKIAGGTQAQGVRGMARENFAAVDIGQMHEFTTVAVVERAEVQGEWDPAAFAWTKRAMLRLRHLERFAPGTPLPAVAERLGQITHALGQCDVLVNVTMTGKPAIELLRARNPHCHVMPAIIVSGHSESYAEGCRRIPIKDLLTGLQIALQQERLQIAGGLEHAAALMEEMAEVRLDTRMRTPESESVWRESARDDLVFATALSCWGAGKAYPGDLRGTRQYARWLL